MKQEFEFFSDMASMQKRVTERYPAWRVRSFAIEHELVSPGRDGGDYHIRHGYMVLFEVIPARDR